MSTDDTNTANPAELADTNSPRGVGILDVGKTLFEWRDYTPIPLILLAVFLADASAESATFGTLIVVFGELIRIYSVSFIGTISRTRNTETTGGNLITSGPFGWVRNPLYVGNFFIVLGVAVYSASLALVIITVLAFAIQYYAIVKYEESLLERRFSQTFRDYMQAVPAWVPQNIPPLSEWEWPDTFSPALKSERRTLTAIAAILVVLLIFS